MAFYHATVSYVSKIDLTTKDESQFRREIRYRK